MAWVIDRDYDFEARKATVNDQLGKSQYEIEGMPSRVGRGQWGTEDAKNEPKPEVPYRFRLRYEDEQDGIAYGGRYDSAAAQSDEGEWGDLYNALKFGEWDVGATILEVKVDEYIAAAGYDPEGETVVRYIRPHADKDGWYIPYG